MKIGIDVDGILADFSPAFMRLLIETSGWNLFIDEDWLHPPCWDWDKLRGYTDAERSAAWAQVKASERFWFNLTTLQFDFFALFKHYHQLMRDHTLYFITSRPGVKTQQQTVHWLTYHLHDVLTRPNVLVVGHRAKGVVAKALELDAYVDDNYDNCVDCVTQAPNTRTYLITRSYNVGPEIARDVKVEDRRIPDLQTFLQSEGLIS